MNEQSEAKVPEAAPTESQVADAKSSLVDAVFDVAEAWAAYGLNVAKLALQTSAKTLEKTAKAIDDVSQNFKKDAA